MAAAEEAERAEALRADAAEAALAVARRELGAARAKAGVLGELEGRYWHDFNDLQQQLRAHVDERDVLLRKVGGIPCRVSRALVHPSRRRPAAHALGAVASRRARSLAWRVPFELLRGLANIQLLLLLLRARGLFRSPTAALRSIRGSQGNPSVSKLFNCR